MAQIYYDEEGYGNGITDVINAFTYIIITFAFINGFFACFGFGCIKREPLFNQYIRRVYECGYFLYTFFPALSSPVYWSFLIFNKAIIFILNYRIESELEIANAHPKKNHAKY
jgi:hypothetical protein